MKLKLLPFLVVLLFAACQKQISTENIPVNKGTISAEKKAGKVDVCHRTGNGSWHTINISINALPAHLAHGDIVPDADGDGYTKVNPCGFGNQNDCNDNNAAIHPGAIEICGNNIDDNCNGQIDEGCSGTITICNQTWQLKNLDISKYRNGDDIPQVTDPSTWAGLTTGAWSYYDNNPSNETVYGKLYNWYAVNDPRGLAPAGFHVPSDAEWTALQNCVFAMVPVGNPGGKMKATGTIESNNGLWYAPNLGATNSCGFTGLPGGTRFDNGTGSGGLGLFGFFWSSTPIDIIQAINRRLSYNDGDFVNEPNDKRYGFSVRCIKD